ncbi:MAG: hypothetical protein Q3971_09645 [Moraxella sp.]|nr:hypothetical protein [Moraxella sp.]
MHPTILKVFGLIDYADNWLSLADKRGELYVALDADDELYALIAFNFDCHIEYSPAHYEDGYRVYADDAEIDKVFNITWHITETDTAGLSWTPCDDDKAIINQIIKDFIFDEGNKQAYSVMQAQIAEAKCEAQLSAFGY